MTLKEHYKFHTRKSMKPYANFIIVLVLFISVFQTLASYSSTACGSQDKQIAKWSLVINNEQITSDTTSLAQPVDLINSADQTTVIDAGDECYFDVTINPSETEVAILYSLILNLSTDSNLPEGTTISKYEKYTGVEETLSSTTVVNSNTLSITENINLPNSNTALQNSSIRKYRVFCKLPDSINSEPNQQYTITPKVTVSQNINNN